MFACVCKVLAYDVGNAITVEEETAMMAVPTERQSKTLRLTGARSKRAVIFARRKRCVNGN